MSSVASNFLVFFALLKRDIKVLISRLWDITIDCGVSLIVDIITIGYLMPLLGMKQELIGPLFIGLVILSMFDISFSLSANLVDDMQFEKFINYHLSLPTTSGWLITSYVAHFVVESAIFTLPRIILGILILGNKFVIYETNWPGFILIYFLVLVLFSTLSLFFSFAYTHDWFFENIWGRRLEPLFSFAAVFFVWKKLYAFSPMIGNLFLLNPITYAAEGIRATLIGGNQFLPLWINFFGILITIVIIAILLFPKMRKKLDHV